MKLTHATSYLLSMLHFIEASKRATAMLKGQPHERELFHSLKTRRAECARLCFRNWQFTTRKSFISLP